MWLPSFSNCRPYLKSAVRVNNLSADLFCILDALFPIVALLCALFDEFDEMIENITLNM